MELSKEHTKLIKKLVKANPKYSGNEDLLEDFCSETYQKSYLILQSVEDMKSLEAYMQKVASSAIMDVLKNSGRLAKTTKKTTTVKGLSVLPKKAPAKKTPSKKTKKAKAPVVKEKEVIIEKEVEITETPVEEVFVEETPVVEEVSFETEPVVETISSEEFFADEITETEIEVETSIDEEYISQEDNSEPEIEVNSVNKPPVLAQDLLYVADPRENIEEQVFKKVIFENIISLVKQIDTECPQEMYLTIFRERYFMQKKQKEIASDIGISQAEVSKRLVQLSRLIKEKLY